MSEIIEPSGYYLRVKECHRRACPDNDCAAALLAFLLWFHKGKQRVKEYARMTNDFLRAQGKEAIADESDWQFHTDEQLRRRVMFWGTDTIQKAIIYLRDEKKFIQTEAPEDFRRIYKTGRTKCFLVNVRAWNKFVIENYAEIESDELSDEVKPLAPLERKKTKTEEQRETARRVFRFWQVVLEHPLVKLDEKRTRKIVSRLKDGKTELELAQAVLGNKASDFHQAKHPKNTRKVFDSISIIFEDAEKVEFFCQIAEENGQTLEATQKQFERIVAEDEKPAPVKNSAEAIKRKVSKNVSPSYSKAAEVLKRLVVDERKKFDDVIVAFFNMQSELELDLLDLQDWQTLADEIVEILKGDEIVTTERRAKIESFTKKFIEHLTK